MDFPDDIIHIIIDLSSQEDQYRWLFVSKAWLECISKKFKKVSYSEKLVELFAKNNKWIDVINSRRWNLALYAACEGGHLNLVNLLIHKGANYWNAGLKGACKGGHLELANLMIEKGANFLDWGLWYACKGGHLKLTKLMIHKGATQCRYCTKSIQDHLK
jgi:hypothetical protein